MMAYFTFKDLYPKMYFIETFAFDENKRVLYVNGKVLNVPEECYDDAKIAMTHTIARGGTYIHEEILSNPYITDTDFDIVYASIQAFLEHKAR